MIKQCSSREHITHVPFWTSSIFHNIHLSFCFIGGHLPCMIHPDKGTSLFKRHLYKGTPFFMRHPERGHLSSRDTYMTWYILIKGHPYKGTPFFMRHPDQGTPFFMRHPDQGTPFFMRHPDLKKGVPWSGCLMKKGVPWSGCLMKKGVPWSGCLKGTPFFKKHPDQGTPFFKRHPDQGTRRSPLITIPSLYDVQGYPIFKGTLSITLILKCRTFYGNALYREQLLMNKLSMFISIDVHLLLVELFHVYMHYM